LFIDSQLRLYGCPNISLRTTQALLTYMTVISNIKAHTCLGTKTGKWRGLSKGMDNGKTIRGHNQLEGPTGRCKADVKGVQGHTVENSFLHKDWIYYT